MDEFYIHLSSDNCKDLYPSNTTSDFKVQLPERFELQGTWKCALVEIEYTLPSTLPTTISSLYLNTNICDGSIVGPTKLPILRRLPLIPGTRRDVYSLPHYYPIKTYQLDVIHLYINTDIYRRASFFEGVLLCTLHFKRTA